jgi:hypothetical protein
LISVLDPQPSSHGPSRPWATQKCNDNGFCRRLRGKTGTKYNIEPSSVAINGPDLTAVLTSDEEGKWWGECSKGGGTEPQP